MRDFFSSVAVARPLPRKGKSSKSYYHKFKQHDYFYDVWSNIHYGYVGRSVGFSEAILLKGSTWEQNMTPGAMGDDTMDDITREGANKQVISSQADSLIKISRIWADFFPANTSNQPI
ncbi:polymorphic toxin type 44 domain-containing protein [Klebsiella pneumoniae]|nr:polymorphic toxin type 44 domain-containing protein [Klebsiella pneumoniae]